MLTPRRFLDPLQLNDTNSKDVASRPAPEAVAVKEAAALEPQSTAASPSGGVVKLEAVKSHVTCALCTNLIASSLVLSCGHQYCGSCLFDWLGNKPCCPSCQVSGGMAWRSRDGSGVQLNCRGILVWISKLPVGNTKRSV